ncbi:hypothetical protein N7456_011507 [Penicillium angulare]|uniref:Fungal N-terminal domain-containing protein n=1 Tax=Penicillium angulare TaxID=116970 RepID=A0A9W9ETZ2_9EURO|nr:hypothetical protein N7456_011507 [Penicillium angulare]
MADPLSIASGAAGLLSLGIQVTQSLVDFYCAYKDQDSDLAKITRNLESLLNLFQSLEKALEDRQPHTDTLLQEIANVSAGCSEIIHELEDEWKKLEKIPGASFKERIQVAGRRVAYPFRKSTLQKLEEDVSDMREILQLALGVLQVEHQTRLETDISELKALIGRMSSIAMFSEVCSRLKAPDATVNHNTASEKRHQDTGSWFISSSSFQNWLFERNAFLWINGFVGSGKSVLCSTAIEQTFYHTKDMQDKGIAFFYFSFADEAKQNASGMLRALLLQLSVQLEGSEGQLQSVFTQYPTGIPPVKALLQCLRQIVSQFSNAYILLDALDESPLGTERDVVLETLQTMRQWDIPGLHLLVTSRDEQNIRDQLNVAAKKDIKMRNPGTDDDIAQFITYHLQNDHNLQQYASSHAQIQTTLMEKAHGMFKYIECQLTALRQVPNKAHLNRCLSSLPRDLEQTYERMLCDIDPIYADDVKRFLNVLCVSKEALTVDQLLLAHAIDLTDLPHYNFDRLYNRQSLADICRGLIEFQDSESKTSDKSQIVRIAHLSIKEYLESDRILLQKAAHFAIQKESANAELAQICLVLLMDPCLTQEPKGEEDFFPLTWFAARNWLDLYKGCCQQGSRVTDLVNRFFKNEPKSFKAWVKLYNMDKVYEEEVIGGGDPPQPLYYAAFLGLEYVVESLTNHSPEEGCESPDVNAQGGVLNTALGAASYHGHERIVKILLGKGADVHISGGLYGSVLEAASCSGNKSIVQLLVDKGADLNPSGGLHGNPLQAASLYGHGEIVQFLLDRGAEINAQGGLHATAMDAAATNGHESIVQTLADRGADLTSKETSTGNLIDLRLLSWTPLLMQVGMNYGVVRMFTTFYGSGLQAAAFKGYDGIVKILLDQGANANSRGGIYSTGPQIASIASYSNAIHKLVDPDLIEITAQETFDKYLDIISRGSSPLNSPYWSPPAYRGVSAVRLDASITGSDPNAFCFNESATTDTQQEFYTLGGESDTGVSWSFNKCDIWVGRNYGDIAIAVGCNLNMEKPELYDVNTGSVVKVDINYGTVTRRTPYYGDALQAAACAGHENIVRMLLDKGADINAVGGLYGTALEAASRKPKIRQILIAEMLNRLQLGNIKSTGHPLRRPSHAPIKLSQSISMRGLRGNQHRRKRINGRVERQIRMRTKTLSNLKL